MPCLSMTTFLSEIHLHGIMAIKINTQSKGDKKTTSVP